MPCAPGNFRVSESNAFRLGRGKRRFRPPRNHGSFLLGERREQVEHERIGIGAPSSATMNATRCAISPEMNATSRERRSSLATPTEQPRRFTFAGGGGELRLAIERVGPFSDSNSTNSPTISRVGFGEGLRIAALQCRARSCPACRWKREGRKSAGAWSSFVLRENEGGGGKFREIISARSTDRRTSAMGG